MSETRTEVNESTPVATEDRRGSAVISIGLIALLTLIQVTPVMGGKRLVVAAPAYVAAILVLVAFLFVVHRFDVFASVLLPSAVIEISLLITTYAEHRVTVLGLLRDLAMGGQRDPVEIYFSWFVPSMLLSILVGAGPRRSKAWFIFIAVILLLLCVPVAWPPDGVFI